MSTKKERMYARIQQHGENLNAIFDTRYSPNDLCKALRRLETVQNRANELYCNGDITEAEHDKATARTQAAARKILGDTLPIYINSDPRGYALKIETEMMRQLQAEGKNLHTDWGGYGIIAPDLTND